MINTSRQDNDLLATVSTDLKELGIEAFSRDNLLEQIKAGVKVLVIEHRQPFGKAGQSKNIDYNLVLRNSDYMRFYHPITLFVRITDEPNKSRVFRLTEGEYFTLPQAVNLLENRPVARRELTADRKIKDTWYTLDENKRDSFGNASLTRVVIAEEALFQAIDGLPIKPPSPEKEQIIAKLKNGDRVPLTLLRNGIDQQTHISVSPISKTVVEQRQDEQKKSRGKAKHHCIK